MEKHEWHVSICDALFNCQCLTCANDYQKTRGITGCCRSKRKKCDEKCEYYVREVEEEVSSKPNENQRGRKVILWEMGDGKTIQGEIIEGKDTKKTEFAVCCESDTYDFAEGCRITLNRLFENELVVLTKDQWTLMCNGFLKAMNSYPCVKKPDSKL